MDSFGESESRDAEAEAVDRVIESFEHDAAAHTRANAAVQHPLPAGAEFASPVRRLGAWALEAVLFVVTLGVGWAVWAFTMSDVGQTPAKKLLGLRVLLDDQRWSAGLSRMRLMRGFLGGIVVPLVAILTLGIILFMPLWDPGNRNLWDRISSCVVVHDPDGQWQGQGERMEAANRSGGQRHR